MFEVVETLVFAGWIGQLKDHRARARINIRIKRLRGGNFGDHGSVGGVEEKRRPLAFSGKASVDVE
jgi:putative addiction module killer protein